MGPQINDLVKMGDAQSLYEIMAEDDDWMNQLDAAEGLVKLGDRRGLEFLLSARYSDEKEVQQVAKEILESKELAPKRAELEAQDEREFQAKVENGKKRLQKGNKVFRYKMVYVPASDILSEDPAEEGFQIPALDAFGLEGWEVIHMLPRRRQVLVSGVDDAFTGAYILLKKEVAPDESAELDEI
jgi:hypothetical protein